MAIAIQFPASATRLAAAGGESAFGAAVIAASLTCYNNMVEAVQQMVRLQRSLLPDRRRMPVYEGLFQRFGDELRKRSYL